MSQESHLRNLCSSAYRPANEQYECPVGIVLHLSNYEADGIMYRLHAHPDLSLPIEGFIGKRVGVKGIAIDQFVEHDGIENLLQVIEVHEFYNHYYPDTQIREDADSYRSRSPRTPDEQFLSKPVSPCPRCGGYFNDHELQSMIFIDAQSCKNLRCSCPPPHPSEVTGMSFTQQQLEAAWKQMEYERKQDGLQAHRMLEWVCQQAMIDPGHASLTHEGFSTMVNISPQTTTYRFIFIHQTYGPYLYDFINALSTQSWARHVRGEQSGPVYEVDTPKGTYEVHFSYFDNHSTGW